MSVPARASRVPAQAARPAPSTRRPATATKPVGERRAPAPRPTADEAFSRRSQHSLRFAVLSALVAATLVVGLVTLNAMVAQRSFRIDDLQARVDDLSRHNVLLERQAARLSAPERIAAWAQRHGMRLAPDGDLHILQVAGGATTPPVPADAPTESTGIGGAPGGGRTTDDSAGSLKSIVAGAG
jgi:cell division protein FtsL